MRTDGWIYAALLSGVLLLQAACGWQEERGLASGLAAVPQLDLSGAEDGARRQLEEHRRRLEILLPEAGAKAAEAAEAFGDLGLLYVTYDFLEAAEVCFANAQRLQPEDVRWPYLEAYLLQAQGRLAEAVGRFDRALELDPTSPATLLRSGRAQLDLGQLEEARERFLRALELSPGTAAGHEGLGKAAVAAGDLRAAIQHFERALELEPRATALHYVLSQAYRALGEEEKAELHLGQRGDVSPRIPDPLLSALATRAASSQFYLIQGAEALEDGNYGESAASYRQALELDSESIAALRGLSVSLAGLGDVGGAAEALQKALAAAGRKEDSRSERAGLLRSLGDLLARGGRPAEAAGVYRQSLELAPDQPEVRLLRADALARSGSFEEALEAYEELSKSQIPGLSTTLLVKKATVLVNLGRGVEARAAFRQAVDQEPGNPRLRLRLAEALAFLGDTGAAAEQRAAAERLIPEGPAGASVFTDMARSAQRAGDLKTAEKDYLRALKRDPKALGARAALADLLTVTGRFDEAARELRQALKQDSRHQPSHQGLVRALVLGGRFGQARVQLQESLRTFPQDLDLALDQVRLLASCPDPAVLDGSLALEVALRASEISSDPSVRAALALAHAAAGQWDEAIALQGRLVEEAEERGDPVRRALFEARLRSFERRRPWTAASGEEILDLLR